MDALGSKCWMVMALAAASGCDGAPVQSEGSHAGASGAGGASAGAGGMGGVNPVACGVADPELADLDAADLFDYSHVPTFDIHLPQDEWEALQRNARDEEYVEAEACFEGRAIGRVGLRFKGAVGSLTECFDEQGEMICRKLSMKLKFSEYDRDQRFYGMKRLNFNSNKSDDSRMKEKLAFDLYRAMGIVTPRASWAVVRVNDESQGLYGMVEQVDGRFTADRWPDNPDGNLYKEIWPSHTDTDYITTKLKTNEEVGDISAFVAFAEAMNASAEEELRSTLASYTDITYLERVLAVGDAILDYDGLTYFWTDGVSSSNHNYYFYEEAPDNFTLIPWDVEATFWLNPAHVAPHWTVEPDDCTETYPYWSGLAMASGCDVVFKAMAADLSGWRAAGQEFLDGPFALETMLATIEGHADFIRAEAEADPTPQSFNDFESEIANLRSLIPTLRSRFEHLLAGLPWEPLTIDITAVTDFETQSDSTLIGPGSWLGANPNSSISVEVNTDSSMGGERDLLLSFEYANEEEPWQQWGGFIIPFLGHANDLTSLTGIRMMVRGGQSRTLRLNVDSTLATTANDFVRYGWDVPLTDEATEVEVLFEDATLVAWQIEQNVDPGYSVQDGLAAAIGLHFEPVCVGRDANGMLPEGTTDVGSLYVDDIEFF